MSELERKDFALTAGLFPAIRACPASRVYAGPKAAPSHGAWWGIAIHRFIEYVAKHGEEYALEYIDTKFPRMYRCCSSIDLTAIPEGRHEVKLIIDTATHAVTEGRSEEVTASSDAHGRADLIYRIDEGYENAVLDWKTGTRTDFDASQDEQLLTLAVGLWLKAGRPKAPIHGALVGVRSNGDLDWYRAQYYVPQLEQHLREMRRLVLLTDETRNELAEEGIAPEFIPGDHCKSCMATLGCPKAQPDAVKYKRGK